ncbi:MAG: GNAT family N-acetyltransferase [Armatimonas sp.]
MRIIFDYRPSPERPPLDWRERVPDGFVIRRIDADIAERLQSALIAGGIGPWFDRVWGSIPDFLEQGFGFVAEWEGENPPFIAANCRMCPMMGNGQGSKEKIAAIQVSTRARFQGQGLATLVCAAFLEHCLEHGLTPEYSCEEENLASAALAIKLGFVPVGKV